MLGMENPVMHVRSIGGWCEECGGTGDPGIMHVTPLPGGNILGPPSAPQNGDLTLAEQAVVGAVIAPIARRMALVMAQRAHLAACDEILRRIEAENTTTVLGNTRLDAIFTIVKAVRSSQPQVG